MLYWRWRKRAFSRLGDSRLVALLMPDASRWKQQAKWALLLTAVAFLAIGWANPQWGNKREQAKRKSVDVVIALDISNSMYADDLPPNRLERAKKFAEILVEKLKGERIGLVLFAGGAFLQMPLTTDYGATTMFLQSASPELAGTQGTAIAEAIRVAQRSFPPDDKSHKALVLITDGEDHDGDAEKAAAEAREQGVIQFTVGVGTSEGGFIPMKIRGLEDYKRDEQGEPVRSKLNEAMLEQLAEAGDGEYYPIGRGDAVAEALRKRIDQLEKKELEVRAFSAYESYFQYFILVGLLLLAAEFMLSYRKGKWLDGADIFR